MTHPNLPSRDAIKVQARRLRDTLAKSGTKISHANALEHMAHQWGYQDWNTLSASLSDAPDHRWQLGQSVTGTYLGHPFMGTIKSVQAKGPRFTQMTVAFDTPIDVVRSDRFSSFRRQVTCTINHDGRTLEKTSDGQPHVVLSF